MVGLCPAVSCCLYQEVVVPLLSGVFVQTFGLVKLALNITTGHMGFCRIHRGNQR